MGPDCLYYLGTWLHLDHVWKMGLEFILVMILFYFILRFKKP